MSTADGSTCVMANCIAPARSLISLRDVATDVGVCHHHGSTLRWLHLWRAQMVPSLANQMLRGHSLPSVDRNDVCVALGCTAVPRLSDANPDATGAVREDLTQWGLRLCRSHLAALMVMTDSGCKLDRALARLGVVGETQPVE